MGKAGYFLGAAAAAAAALGAAAAASETVTYKYDALGRLQETVHSGGVNDGQAQSLCYDPAGNRTQYQSSASGSLASCGSGGGGGGNQAPTPADDSGSQATCTTAVHDVTANDTDPDGNYPLSVVSVTGSGFSVHSSTSLQFVSTLSTGNKSGTYTVQDALGATATATLTVNVTSGGTCL